MGIYVIALYFGNSLGPIFTGIIVQCRCCSDAILRGSHAHHAQTEIGIGLHGLLPLLEA